MKIRHPMTRRHPVEDSFLSFEVGRFKAHTHILIRRLNVTVTFERASAPRTVEFHFYGYGSFFIYGIFLIT